MSGNNVQTLRSLQLCIKLLKEVLDNPKNYNLQEPLETRLRFVVQVLEKVYDKVSYADD